MRRIHAAHLAHARVLIADELILQDHACVADILRVGHLDHTRLTIRTSNSNQRLMSDLAHDADEPVQRLRIRAFDTLDDLERFDLALKLQLMHDHTHHEVAQRFGRL